MLFENKLEKVLYYETDLLVSINPVEPPHSCVFDTELTSEVGYMVKVVGWYDNETEYPTG